MKSKKMVAMLTSVCLLAGTSLTATAKTTTAVPEANTAKNSAVSSFYKNGGPIDLSVANEDAIIEMLKKEGKLAKDASFEEAHAAYVEYMREMAEANKKPATMLEKKLAYASEQQKAPKKIQGEEVKNKVKVLTLLVDYNDYKHGSIQPDESAMYYPKYEKEHYENMLFGDNGYTGPNGENFVSMKQYYEEQSGGTFTIEGEVAGWYTVDKDAAYYGAQVGSSNDSKPRNLIADTLKKAALDPNLNLKDFDIEDRYDLDGDGNYNEPDGVIDHLMVIHAGVGQEAGGGSLGSDAIWSHRWNLGGMFEIPGTGMKAYDYTVEPEDGAAGVFAHEFGHDLGLPDEYDTDYTSSFSEPISNWSIMSSGSWAGKIGGTEPSGFSPYAKEFFQKKYGGDWQRQITLNYEDLKAEGTRVALTQASQNGEAVRINLPDRANKITTPVSGKYAYWGGTGESGKAVKTSMAKNVSLKGATKPGLQFKTWYDIETGWDFASIQVREVGATDWTFVQGNITTTEHDPSASVIVPHGITGNSAGKWVDANFDLTAFAGKEIELKFEYETDAYSFGAGFYVDNIAVMDGSNKIFADDVDSTPAFTLNGFEQNDGAIYAENYYLVEWRNYHGVDKGLKNISVAGQTFSYDPGMVVWYVNNYFTDNWTGVHPGGGYLSVVDADQKNIPWVYRDGKTPSMFASNKYQMHDAAFSINKGTSFKLNLIKNYGRMAVDPYASQNRTFSDKTNYKNAQIPELGVDLENNGVNIKIVKQASDNSSATIEISKK